MFFKKFLFLFMSSLVTCWGIDTPEYKSNISAYPDLPEKLNILLDEEKKGLYDALIQKFKSLHEYPEHCTAVNIQENSWEEKGPDFKELSDKFKGLHERAKRLNKTKPVAHRDLEKAHPESWEATKLFWEAAEKFYGQVNTTEHTNEEKFYDQVNTTEHTNEEKFYDQVNTTEHTNEEKFYDQVNTTEHTNEEKFCDQLNTTEHTNEEKLELHLQESFEDYLEQWNTLKEVELMAIEAYKKYKNTEGNEMNISLLCMQTFDKNDIF
ncbi:hypothetical protein KSF78_0004578 [Schistosoma japonicum]|nr:hypothetical protein KSF78_0004578 [Schistosoma japonicum]